MLDSLENCLEIRGWMITRQGRSQEGELLLLLLQHAVLVLLQHLHGGGLHGRPQLVLLFPERIYHTHLGYLLGCCWSGLS